ncbi:MAG TPA: DUF5946 family protein [Pirellulales bacterium]|nr:DUF5946 family protein [Pirellulales bacterium]
MCEDQHVYDELALYTLGHEDPSFIHQYVVDARAAMQAGPETKPITLTFALVGLYLHVEKKWAGRQVQKAHMKMARFKKAWPAFDFPDERGDVTVAIVLAAEPGPARDGKIDAWCESVWKSWSSCRANREKVVKLVKVELGVD